MVGFPRKESGWLVVMGSAGGENHINTIQCGHCGGHWVPTSGSGKVRGFCQNCCRPFCGPACSECVPVEQYLENLECGRPENFRPIISRASD